MVVDNSGDRKGPGFGTGRACREGFGALVVGTGSTFSESRYDGIDVRARQA